MEENKMELSEVMESTDTRDPKILVRIARARERQAIRRDINNLLAKGEKLALEKLYSLLENMSTVFDVDNFNILITALKNLADVRLTNEWTTRLSGAIERDPKNLTPGSAVSSPLLSKLKSFATQTRRASKADGRDGVEKSRDEVPFELPPEEE